MISNQIKKTCLLKKAEKTRPMKTKIIQIFFLINLQNVRKCREKLKDEEKNRAERLHFLKSIEIPRLKKEILLEYEKIENLKEFFYCSNLEGLSQKQWMEFLQSDCSFFDTNTV